MLKKIEKLKKSAGLVGQYQYYKAQLFSIHLLSDSLVTVWRWCLRGKKDYYKIRIFHFGVFCVYFRAEPI